MLTGWQKIMLFSDAFSGPALAGIAEACVAPVGAATMIAVGGRCLPDLETAAARHMRRQR